ncbi:MAG: DKNYY domain-containing protein [Pseudomonadota bacterium]
MLKKTFLISISLALAACYPMGYRVAESSVTWYHHHWAGEFKISKTLEDADPKSFKQLSNYYAVDNNHAFWREKVIPGANPKTFALIAPDFAKDDKRVYRQTDVLTDSNPESFELLDGWWSKDRDDYFYQHHNINVCHHESFKLVDEPFPTRALEKHCYYVSGNMVPVSDFKSLQILRKGYAKDSKHVYFLSGIVENADPVTFLIPARGWPAQDKNNCYSSGIEIECR